MWCANHGGGGGVLRRTRSSHPWALSTRHPWRVTVRCNTPTPPPEVACPPCIKTSCPLRGNRRIAPCRLDEFSFLRTLQLNTAVSTSIPEPSRNVECMRVADARCTGPSRAMDGAWRAPRDGSSVSGAPTIRHPHATRMPSEVAPRSSAPTSNAQDSLKRYRFS